MNKSDGGEQRKQKNTVIPMTNPDDRFCSKLQAMTLPNGEAKGMKCVLKGRGFSDLHKLRAKCSPVCPIKSENCCMA